MTITQHQNDSPARQAGQVPAAPTLGEAIPEVPAATPVTPTIAGEMITASVEITATRIIAPTSGDEFPDPEDYHRRHVLAFYLMSWCDCQLARLSRRRPPVPYRA